MAKRQKHSTAAIQSLLDERSQIERWLRRLGMATDQTPENVRRKVRTDYGRRLDAILEELQGYREELVLTLEQHRDLRDGLVKQEEDASESLAEAELRHSVGEYDEPKWSAIRSEILESLTRIRDELSGAQQEISSLEEVLEAIDASGGAEDEEFDDEEHVSAESLEEAAHEAVDAGELEAPEPEGGSEAGEGVGSRKTDELAFLQSVIQPDRATPDSSSPKKVEAPAQEAGVGADGVEQVKRRGIRPAKGSSKKTVKCAECGTLNLPTEWYCENCGAELTAL
jgi:hypothetical protein